MVLKQIIQPIFQIQLLWGEKIINPLVFGSTEYGGYFTGTLHDVIDELELLGYGVFDAGGIDDLGWKLISPQLAEGVVYGGAGGEIGQFTPPILPDQITYDKCDYDQDGKVGPIDLSHFVDFWLTEGDPNTSEGTDLNEDWGVVSLDCVIFCNHWRPHGYQLLCDSVRYFCLFFHIIATRN